MSNDLRREQVTLLRFEKQIAGLAAALAACGTAAKAADGKLHASQGAESFSEMQAALLQLAEVTDKAHEAMNAKAIEASATIFEAAGGGLPKIPPSKVVASILGLG
ncbi:MAG: hypothetical protein AAGC77_03570 [Pseudomonadota bacterium]